LNPNGFLSVCGNILPFSYHLAGKILAKKKGLQI
jgi:hypothetical protein